MDQRRTCLQSGLRLLFPSLPPYPSIPPSFSSSSCSCSSVVTASIIPSGNNTIPFIRPRCLSCCLSICMSLDLSVGVLTCLYAFLLLSVYLCMCVSVAACESVGALLFVPLVRYLFVLLYRGFYSS